MELGYHAAGSSDKLARAGFPFNDSECYEGAAIETHFSIGELIWFHSTALLLRS
jgi:hypothetical protein